MEITEVKVQLMTNRKDKLAAFCSVTFDDAFVVHDVKVIAGVKGAFVAMPSRKIMERCGKCGIKNPLLAKFCNGCGGNLNHGRLALKDKDGRLKLHADIVHPINSTFRDLIQEKVLKVYHEEMMKSRPPGYISPRLSIPDNNL